jgi:hypothetical protein
VPSDGCRAVRQLFRTPMPQSRSKGGRHPVFRGPNRMTFDPGPDFDFDWLPQRRNHLLRPSLPSCSCAADTNRNLSAFQRACLLHEKSSIGQQIMAPSCPSCSCLWAMSQPYGNESITQNSPPQCFLAAQPGAGFVVETWHSFASPLT